MPSPYLLLIICIVISVSAQSSSRILVGAERKVCPPPFTPRIVGPNEEAQLRVVVPNIALGSLRQLVDCSDPSNVHGFCIDVFHTALSTLSPSPTISYTCFNFTGNLTYKDMIAAVANGLHDVVVGDVTISAQRLYDVDFTHKYLESGVVIISKKTIDNKGDGWLLFGSPFTWRMWCMVVGAFASTGILLWLLECRSNPEFNEGSFTIRISKVFGFIMEALVLLQRDPIKSTTGQLVMVAWVFVVLLLTSSYTAGLSSILTANNLSSDTNDIITLKDSNKSIAYRRGSVVKDYLITRLHIREEQLKPIRATLDFIGNITAGPSSGGVIAIIDELPYANIMLANLSCDYAITGPQLTSEGFGFGFRRGLQNWEKNISIALLNLIENGCLQELQENRSIVAKTNRCSSVDSQSKKVSWRSLLPLFLVLVFLSHMSVIISYIINITKRNVETTMQDDPNISSQDEPLRRHSHEDLELSAFS